MLDARIRPLIDPPLNRAGRWLAERGARADQITWIGFALGAFGALFAAAGLFKLALLFILAGRVMDGLDGAVARATIKTDRGGFLDITLDFIFYALVPLGFALADPARNALAAAALLASFLASGAVFLAYAAAAAEQGKTTSAQGEKSIYYLGGLTEGFETIAAFVLFCLFPGWFPWLAAIFALMVAISTAARLRYGVETL